MKLIKRGEAVPVSFTPQERDVIIESGFIDPSLTDRLKSAVPKGKTITAFYSIADLDHLINRIADEANHADDEKTARIFDRLYDRLCEVQYLYIEED